MDLLSSIILGIIQGVAEFLPISSSAHLIIFRDVFGIGAGMNQNMALCFDIALHLGTLLAIVTFFFLDFWDMLIKGFTKGVKDKQGKILWYLILATIPAAVFGTLFEEPIEEMIRTNFILIAVALAFVGILIYWIDKKTPDTKTISQMRMKDAIIIGCSQCFALIPGFSRSGTTIAAGRACGMKKEDAAKFSFYLSAPVVFGAVVFQLLKEGTIDIILNNLAIFVVGIMVSFLIGLLCIKFLLKYLKSHDFKIFMWYRIALALIVVTWVLIR